MTAGDKFWSWFLSNRVSIERLFESDPPAAVRMIETRFRAASPGLVFEISPKARPREFVVSADGHTERFDAVIAITKLAPEIPGWKVVAFRQPDDLVGIEYNGHNLRKSSLFVDIGLSAEGFVDLILYLPYTNTAAPSDIEAASVLLLDSSLGEYVAAKRIRHVNFVDVKQKPSTALPFDSLRKYFTDHRDQIKDYK